VPDKPMPDHWFHPVGQDPAAFTSFVQDHRRGKAAKDTLVWRTFQAWMDFRTKGPDGMAVFRPGHPKYGGNLGLWPGEFIQYLHEEGSRGQPVLTDVKNLKAAFRTEGLNSDIWDSYEATLAKECCDPDNEEIRATQAKQRLMAKYDINFEVLYHLWQETQTDTLRWDENLTGPQADGLLAYIIAFLLFDIGVRGGNLAATGKETGPDVELEPTEEELDEGEEDEAAEQALDKRCIFRAKGHMSRNCDWTFFFTLDDGERVYVTGEGLYAHWKRYPKHTPAGTAEYAEVRFPTSKTRQATATPATIARRSDMENDSFENILEFKHWNGQSLADEAFFRRRAITSNRGRHQYRMSRVEDTVKRVKSITERNGVSKYHVSARSFRKGNVTMCFTLGGREEKAEQKRIMDSVIRRGGKWTLDSQVPELFYRVKSADIGPYGRVETWEQAILLGGGFQAWRDRQGAEVPL